MIAHGNFKVLFQMSTDSIFKFISGLTGKIQTKCY